MPEFKTIEVNETPYLYTEGTCSMLPEEISKAMGAAFQKVWDFMQSKGIDPAGPGLSVYYTYDPEVMNFRSGFVVVKKVLVNTDNDVKSDVIPAGRALHFTHKGPYSTLRDDYGLMMQYMQEYGLEMSAPCWELYMNDPAVTPEEELITECHMALKN